MESGAGGGRASRPGKLAESKLGELSLAYGDYGDDPPPARAAWGCVPPVVRELIGHRLRMRPSWWMSRPARAGLLKPRLEAGPVCVSDNGGWARSIESVACA